MKRTHWRTGKVRLDASGMAALRSKAWQRGQGKCECWKATGKKGWCGRVVTWHDGQLHHIISRGRGGSDVIENVAFISRQCHQAIHGNPQWGITGNSNGWRGSDGVCST